MASIEYLQAPTMETKDFQPLLQPTKGPVRQKVAIDAYLRDQLPLTTWIALGGIAQGLLYLILGRIGFLPAIVYLLVKTADAYAIKTGLKHNHYRDGVIEARYCAQFPDENGKFGSVACKDEICVFHIGSRVNSPLGALEPGWKKLQTYFHEMLTELKKADPKESGYLGSTAWMGIDRTSNNTGMMVLYFRNADYVHKYARGPLHSQGWSWYYNTISKVGNISIFHELYQVPKGNWEAIYGNMAPSGLGAAHFKMSNGQWQTPIVDASKGLRTSNGRMSRTHGSDNDGLGFGDSQTDEEKALPEKF